MKNKAQGRHAHWAMELERSAACHSESKTSDAALRVLVVCSKNSGKIAPFIEEQAESLRKLGHQVAFFTITGKGVKGYLQQLLPLRKCISTFRPDVIHAHYGLSCLLANLQRRVPVVSTYHGSDINVDRVYRFSKLAIRLSAWNIFVFQSDRADLQKGSVVPCGVDTHLFRPKDQYDARVRLGLSPDGNYVLFAGSFDNAVKNAALAKAALADLRHIALIELKGYSRSAVVDLMNAVDAVLMTSKTEGSPQFIKEAMACNCPVVSVPVGDVPEMIGHTEGCILVGYDPEKIKTALETVFQRGGRTQGRIEIEKRGLDLDQVARKIDEIYRRVVAR